MIFPFIIYIFILLLLVELRSSSYNAQVTIFCLPFYPPTILEVNNIDVIIEILFDIRKTLDYSFIRKIHVIREQSSIKGTTILF